ncbi:hypothetical protein Q5530_12905 [Saccharothrix sp. BKS2]|uniref:hypothetical protein n=1 Tax=Saccharothrix sp. BKS2 TaxID=3064400 RepID=UPI0039EA4E12
MELTVPARFNGPPDSGQGGYVCGLLAGLAPPAEGRAVVTLIAPPPLDTPMRLEAGARRSHLWLGDEVVATVGAATRPVPVVAAVPADVARRASEGYLGHRDHPFPTCFVCGHERADGLRLAPGPVPGADGVVACEWVPEDTSTEVLWGVLDCPGGWTADPRADPMVLTRMTAEVVRAPRPGVPHVVVARREERHGRTAVNLTSVYGADGGLVATSTARWTAIDTEGV